jgi:diguanylate cyclase (GGDEF)-like protein
VGTPSEGKIRVVLIGAADDEHAVLVPRLRDERDFALDNVASPTEAAESVVREPPHVLVIGSAPELEERLALVRAVRRDVRLACVRVVWVAREPSFDPALRAGADDIAFWPAPLEGFVARLHEQAAESSVRRISEREAALRAELSRVDEALSRADAEEAALRAQLSSTPRLAPHRPHTDALHDAPATLPLPRELAFRPNPTLEFGRIERRLVTVLRDQHLQQPRAEALSALVIGVDAWEPLLASRGPELGERLLEAVSALVHSLLSPRDAVERLSPSQLCALLPGADEAHAIRLARDVCAQVASAPVKVAPRPFQPTVSVGVATLETDDSGSPFDLVEWAREAHGFARERGGNRWWVYHHGVTNPKPG